MASAATAPDGLPISKLLLSPLSGGASVPIVTPRAAAADEVLLVSGVVGLVGVVPVPIVMPGLPVPLKVISSRLTRVVPAFFISNLTLVVAVTLNESVTRVVLV